jgi:hypothetical protein
MIADNSTIYVSIIPSLLIAMSGLAVLYFGGKQRQMERREDWARQDSVAQKAEDAAAALVASQSLLAQQANDAAELLLVENKKVAEAVLVQTENSQAQVDATVRLEAKADQIHGLVNSNLTATMERELVALKAQCATLTEFIDFKKQELQKETSPETLVSLNILKDRIGSLERELTERERQTEQAAKIMAASEAEQGSA